MGRFYQENNTLLWKGDGEYLKIQPWGKDGIRVMGSYMKEIEESYDALMPVDGEMNQDTQINIVSAQTSSEQANQVVASVHNGKITATLYGQGWESPPRIVFMNQEGKILLEEIDCGGALKRRARDYKPILSGDFSLKATFRSTSDEKIYGMGQYQQDDFNLKNTTLELAHRNSQASVPFYLSSQGYGFLWHNPAVGEVHFSKNETAWQAGSTKRLDYYITAGDTPSAILENYMTVTGKPPMMPEYGLGFWQCKLRYWNQEQLLEVAREYKRRNLPIDVIVCDFFHWPKMGDFRFEEEFFPDPQGMVDELKAMDIELMVSVWPQIDIKSENYDEMKDNNLLIRPERGMNISMGFGGYSNFFDATNPRARHYVWDKCKQNYYDLGIKLFWLDEAEPEFGEYDYDNFRCYEGPYSQIGNIYPLRYSQTFYQGMVDAGQKEVVNLVRCAWAGSQRYGALVWSGDIASTFESFRNQVVAGLHMALSGIVWWTTDIGGFYGGNPKDEGFRELFVRWFQWGTFCPVMRLHGDRMPSTELSYKDGRPYLFTGGDNEVWSYGEENYDILVRFMRLREAMRPYTRRLMQDAHNIGKPIMRPMFYEFPDVAICYELDNQYMFGEELLVAPITVQGMKEREVYLPEGTTWIDIFTEQSYEGSGYITVETPMETMPVFYKGDALPEWLR